jgi:hypothetical protein
VVAGGVEDDLARLESSRLERRTPAPRVGLVELRLVQRSRRLEDPADRCIGTEQPTERRRSRLNLDEVVLRHDRDTVEFVDAR